MIYIATDSSLLLKIFCLPDEDPFLNDGPYQRGATGYFFVVQFLYFVHVCIYVSFDA